MFIGQSNEENSSIEISSFRDISSVCHADKKINK